MVQWEHVWGRRTDFKGLRREKGLYHRLGTIINFVRIGASVFCARLTTTREPFGYHACTRRRRSLLSATAVFELPSSGRIGPDEERFGSELK